MSIYCKAPVLFLYSRIVAQKRFSFHSYRNKVLVSDDLACMFSTQSAFYNNAKLTCISHYKASIRTCTSCIMSMKQIFSGMKI